MGEHLQASTLKDYKELTEQLSKDNVRLRTQISEQREEEKSMMAYLHEQLAEKSATISNLELDITELKESMVKRQARLDEEDAKRREALAKERESLREEFEGTKKKLKDLEHFITIREHMQTEIERLHREIINQQKEFEEKISGMERKQMQERDASRKEMAQRIGETREQLLKLTDDQLETTTKRTIAENERMSTELALQSRQTEKILMENQGLQRQVQNRKYELDIFKSTADQLARKNKGLHKLVKHLHSQLEEHKLVSEAALSSRVSGPGDADLAGQVAKQAQVIDGLRADYEFVMRELESTMKQLEEARLENARIVSLQSESTAFLMDAIESTRLAERKLGAERRALESQVAAGLGDAGAAAETRRQHETTREAQYALQFFLNQLAHWRMLSGNEDDTTRAALENGTRAASATFLAAGPPVLGLPLSTAASPAVEVLHAGVQTESLHKPPDAAQKYRGSGGNPLSVFDDVRPWGTRMRARGQSGGYAVSFGSPKKPATAAGAGSMTVPWLADAAVGDDGAHVK